MPHRYMGHDGGVWGEYSGCLKTERVGIAHLDLKYVVAQMDKLDGLRVYVSFF